MRVDIVRVSPIVLISFLPFTNFVIFPLIYFLPQLILSSHFWSDQQRVCYDDVCHRMRLREYSILRETLRNQLISLKLPEAKFCEVLCKLEIGDDVMVNDLNQFHYLFEKGPFALSELRNKHIQSIMKIYEYSPLLMLFGGKYRLKYHAELIREADCALQREMECETLPNDLLKKICRLRGFNVADLSTNELHCCLKQWVEFTTQLNNQFYHSMLLHAPIFFHPKP